MATLGISTVPLVREDLLHFKGMTGERDRVGEVGVIGNFLPYALSGLTKCFLRDMIEPYVGLWPAVAR